MRNKNRILVNYTEHELRRLEMTRSLLLHLQANRLVLKFIFELYISTLFSFIRNIVLLSNQIRIVQTNFQVDRVFVMITIHWPFLWRNSFCYLIKHLLFVDLSTCLVRTGSILNTCWEAIESFKQSAAFSTRSIWLLISYMYLFKSDCNL